MLGVGRGAQSGAQTVPRRGAARGGWGFETVAQPGDPEATLAADRGGVRGAARGWRGSLGMQRQPIARRGSVRSAPRSLEA
eukprot:11633238-Alexandrium_andersonii.AAC.1